MSPLPIPTLREYAAVVLGLTLAVAAVTWPQALVAGHSVADHIDPLFSMWRLGWFAHATATAAPLFDANIFHPTPATLLLSDAVLLESALAAPFLWAGVPLPLVYNALMLLGMVSSGAVLYHVARLFSVERPAAFFGAVIFTVAPYRLEHVMHLELQWVTPAIAGFAALYHLLLRPSWRSGLALSLLVVAQFLACIYYVVFLVPLMAALVIAAAPVLPRWRATLAYGVAAAALAAGLAYPVAARYAKQSQHVGPRSYQELDNYSARPIDYLATPKENLLYGASTAAWGGNERRLFPGTLALVAALVGLFSARRRLVWAAAVVLIVAFTLSLGVHAWVYRALYDLLPVLHGLRAPARNAIFVLAAVALLAALGFERLLALARGRMRLVVLAVAVLAVIGEYLSPPARLLRVDMNPSVYQYLAQAPPGVVLELPFSPPPGVDGQPGKPVDYDADYTYWSTRHWHPTINGYSGYYPPSYATTRARLEGFPDAAGMDVLAEHDVRYVVLHTFYMRAGDVARISDQLVRRPNVRALGTYRDWIGPALVFGVAAPAAARRP